jgi:hypothetical protein
LDDASDFGGSWVYEDDCVRGRTVRLKTDSFLFDDFSDALFDSFLAILFAAARLQDAFFRFLERYEDGWE